MGRRPLAYKLKESITDIYERVRQKQKMEKQAREQEFSKQQEENTKEDEISPLTKEEKVRANLTALESIAMEITGEDLEFGKKKEKKKKKYKKWITSDDPVDENNIQVKQLKKKKKNYNKEFEPVIARLKNLLLEQGKMKSDLIKRFGIFAGPTTKDGQMNKTLVDLASVINAIGANELSTMKEIGQVKKTIAELYIKQQQIEAKNGVASEGNDMTLLGSDIASSIINQQMFNATKPNMQQAAQQMFQQANQPQTQNEIQAIPDFDPETWSQDDLVNEHTKYESIPHDIVVEFDKGNNRHRFKAVNKETREEIVGFPVPSFGIKAFDESKMKAKDDFNRIYDLEIINQ